MVQVSDLGFTLNRRDVDLTYNSDVDLDVLGNVDPGVSTSSVSIKEIETPADSISGDSVSELTVAKLISGVINSKQITLGIVEGKGDVFLAAGKTDFTLIESGFILGRDDSDNNLPKIYIGTAATGYLYWTAATGLILSGALIAGELHIPDRNATGASFHVATDGDLWMGATETNRADAPVQISNTGVMKLGDIAGSSPYLILDGPAVKIYSSDYISGVMGQGFTLDSNLFEVGNISARGSIQTVNFIKNNVSVISGGQMLCLGSDTLNADMTALDASTLTITGGVTFAVNDILWIKAGTNSEYLTVTNIASAPIYTVTRDQGNSYTANNNPTWQTGTAVVNLGQSGQGAIYLTASDTYAPYIDMFTHAGSPWTTKTTKLRLGYLKGITDLDVGLNATDTYGLYSDSAYLKGCLVANTGKIGGTSGWTISAGLLTAASTQSKMIHPCTRYDDPVYGTWGAGTDAINIGTSTSYKVGGGSVSFDVDVSADANNYAIIAFYPLSVINLSAYEDTGKFKAWVYIPSITNFTKITLVWVSIAWAGYWYQDAIRTDGASLAVGWNHVQWDWAGAAEIGTPDATLIDYIDIRFIYTADYTDQTGFKVNDLRIFSGVEGEIRTSSTAETTGGSILNSAGLFTFDSTGKTINEIDSDLGKLRSISGNIAGWELSSTEFSNGNMKIQSTAERILIGAATAPLTGIGIFQGKDGSDYEFRVGNPSGDYVHWDGSSLNIRGTISASEYQGANFTIGIPCIAYNYAHNIELVQLSMTSGGNMLLAFVIDSSVGSKGLILIWLGKLNGQFVPGYEVGGSSLENFDGASITHGTLFYGAIRHGNYIYWSFGVNELSRGAKCSEAMSFTSNADMGFLASDDTNFFILDDSDDVTVRKYTISGLTATWVSNITLDAASPDGFYWDGIYFWGRNGGVIKKYNSSGVTQQTITLAVTPINLMPGVFVDGGSLYVAYISYWGEYVGARYRRPSLITFIPVVLV